MSSPGQRQQYTFTLGTAARLYFDSVTNTSNVRWSLDGPEGNLVNNRSFNASDAQNIGNPVLGLRSIRARSGRPFTTCEGMDRENPLRTPTTACSTFGAGSKKA